MGVTFPEFCDDSSGERSSVPSEAICEDEPRTAAVRTRAHSEPLQRPRHDGAEPDTQEGVAKLPTTTLAR